MNAKLKGISSRGFRTWTCLLCSISGVMTFGVMNAGQTAYSATTGEALQQTLASTVSQPYVQLNAIEDSSENGTDNTGKPVHMGGKYQFDAKFKMDNGAYDELLTEHSNDAFGSQTVQLFITNKKALYILNGKKWTANGTIPSDTLDEETQLLANIINLKAKQVGGYTEYLAALNGTEIVSLFNNDFLAGQNNTAFNKMTDDLQTRSNDVVTVKTTQMNGQTVISQISLQLKVTLTRKESIALWGATGNQSKIKPFHLSIHSVYNNTFREMPFASPVTAQASSTSK